MGKKKEDPYKEFYEPIISDLNKKSGKKYKHASKNTQTLIRARMEEGYSQEDFFTVHTNQVAEWSRKGGEWTKYLRPETLYRVSKFEGYLNNTPTQNVKSGMAETRADAQGKVPPKNNPLISKRVKDLKEKYE